MKKFLCTSVIIAGTFLGNNLAFANDIYDPNELPIVEEDTYITNTRVNLRTGPSMDFDIMHTIPFGEQVYVLDFEENDWTFVMYDNMVGYVSSVLINDMDEYYADPNNYYSFSNETSYETVETRVGSVELLHWEEVKNIFTVGMPVEVYDIYTGITYNVKSFSNGRHADIDPVTAEDTDLLKQTFNGVWSWDVRPVIVDLNGRKIAASINGMPHAGSANDSNNMDGHVCIHFLGSSTHNGNASYTQLHQDILMRAYELSK